ncbi:MAG TPA: copper-binding protein, partial [Methylophaga sp.]|nr:copper-binding protein [Methylophaga sp.]
LLSTANAFAADHTVSAQGLKYMPMVVEIAVGDSVSWTNMSTHNVEMIEGLVPEGAELVKSAMSEDFTHTFDKEGIYIYKCTPHIGAGMGGAVIVGNPVNLDAIKAQDVSGGVGRIVRKAIKSAEAM